MQSWGPAPNDQFRHHIPQKSRPETHLIHVGLAPVILFGEHFLQQTQATRPAPSAVARGRF